jgi:hypothetical protein
MGLIAWCSIKFCVWLVLGFMGFGCLFGLDWA